MIWISFKAILVAVAVSVPFIIVSLQVIFAWQRRRRTQNGDFAAGAGRPAFAADTGDDPRIPLPVRASEPKIIAAAGKYAGKWLPTGRWIDGRVSGNSRTSIDRHRRRGTTSTAWRSLGQAIGVACFRVAVNDWSFSRLPYLPERSFRDVRSAVFNDHFCHPKVSSYFPWF